MTTSTKATYKTIEFKIPVPLLQVATAFILFIGSILALANWESITAWYSF